ncbi:VanZ family protein [Paenibacillus sp. YPG26]|nr:VanZ family protein [Paenibacillus sp. YPG26]
MLYCITLIYIVWIRGNMPSDRFLHNFIPFKTILSYLEFHSIRVAIQNVLGNLLLIFPMGAFAFYNIRLMKGTGVFIYALLISIIIELGQFLLFLVGISGRVIDIDDIILNTSGCIAGFYIVRFLHKKLGIPNSSHLNKSTKRGI